MKKFNRKIHLDRIGSVTHPARLGSIVEVSSDCVAEEGAIVVGRALGESRLYGELELPSGRKASPPHSSTQSGGSGSAATR